MRFLDHRQWHTTVVGNPLEEESARRRDLYLTTYNTPMLRATYNKYLLATTCTLNKLSYRRLLCSMQIYFPVTFNKRQRFSKSPLQYIIIMFEHSNLSGHTKQLEWVTLNFKHDTFVSTSSYHHIGPLQTVITWVVTTIQNGRCFNNFKEKYTLPTFIVKKV